MSTTQTNVGQAEIEDLENLLGMPGAGSVITADGAEGEGEDPGTPSFFTKETVDMKAFENHAKPQGAEAEGEEGGSGAAEGEEGSAGAGATGEVKPEDIDELLDVAAAVAEGEEGESSNAGRPKLDKAGMAQLAEKLIEKELILPFQDEKSLEDYTMEDYVELFEVNMAEKEKAVRAETPQEFFASLPPELQQAATYVAQGGKDIKGLFKHLASAQEIKELNPETDRGQEQIVREYLRTTNYGNDEDIQEEIDTWKDLGKLREKADKFKPKLDKMQEQIVQQQIVQQEGKRKQQEDASFAYMENVYETLKGGELNGIAINGKTQNMLYAGMVQPNYPSISGKDTNLFGHLIEKYQFVEPRHDLIAEALWLLADPDGYKSQIRTVAKNEQVGDTARLLKTEAANKGQSGAEPATNQGSRTKGLDRPTKDFFKR